MDKNKKQQLFRSIAVDFFVSPPSPAEHRDVLGSLSRSIPGWGEPAAPSPPEPGGAPEAGAAAWENRWAAGAPPAGRPGGGARLPRPLRVIR